MKYKSYYWNFFSVPVRKSVTKWLGKEKGLEYQRIAKSGVPKNFNGKLLEVPVGTGILTMHRMH